MPSSEPSWIRIQQQNEWGMSIMKQKTSVRIRIRIVLALLDPEWNAETDPGARNFV
jgi:hypothetical protein